MNVMDENNKDTFDGYNKYQYKYDYLNKFKNNINEDNELASGNYINNNENNKINYTLSISPTLTFLLSSIIFIIFITNVFCYIYKKEKTKTDESIKKYIDE